MAGAARQVFCYHGHSQVPGQLELIDNGVSSESDSSDDAAPVPESPQRSPSKVTTPMRIALNRYTVTKDEVIQHLCEQWSSLLASDGKDSTRAAIEELSELSTLIGIQRRWLSNYECSLFAMQMVSKMGSDLEQLRQMLVLHLRWWFCCRFGVHLSQLPHLGNEVVLFNSTVGVLSSIWSRAKILMMLQDYHDEMGSVFNDIMITKTKSPKQHSIDAESCNTLLLRIMPLLKRGVTEPDCEPVCSKMIRFMGEAVHASYGNTFNEGFRYCTVVGPNSFHANYSTEELLDELWSGILKCNATYGARKTDCSCHSRVAQLLMDQVSQVIASARSKEKSDSDCDPKVRTKRVISYFLKWVTLKSGVKCNHTSALQRAVNLLSYDEKSKASINMMLEHAKVFAPVDFTIKANKMKEEPKDAMNPPTLAQSLIPEDTYIIESFARFYTATIVSSDHDEQNYLNVIAAAILLIEQEQLAGEVSLDIGYAAGIMESHLTTSSQGHMVLSKIRSDTNHYRWSSGPVTCSTYEPEDTRKYRFSPMREMPGHRNMDFTRYIGGHTAEGRTTLCCCYESMHNELCSAAQAHSSDVIFMPHLVMSSNNGQMQDRRKVFHMAAGRARHMLQELCDSMLYRQTSAGNIPVILSDTQDARSDSVIYAIVALASLMGNTVTILKDQRNSSIIRIGVILDSGDSMAPVTGSDENCHQDCLELLLRLMHCEIASDAIMTLEYRNPKLGTYRTLLVYSIFKALMMPNKSEFSIRFKCGTVADFDIFFRRLMRLIFFRIHQMLQEEHALDSFMRIRVVYYNLPKDEKDEKFLEEISRGYLDLDEEDIGKASSDSEAESDQTVDYRIFGFLEYSRNHKLDHSIPRVTVKQESDLGSSYDDNLKSSCQQGNFMFFFETVFSLCAQLRFCIDADQLFQHNKVDRLLYQMLLHLCHVDNSVSNQRKYEHNVISNIKKVYETTEYGELVQQSSHLERLGVIADCDAAEPEEPFHDNPRDADKSSNDRTLIKLQLLFLSRRKYTNRLYYILSRMAIESMVRWLTSQSAACALCRWASSIPIDNTSRVKSHKPATAQAIVTMLSLSLLSHMSQESLEDISAAVTESLVSAANVCFVNLKVSFDPIPIFDEAIDVDEDNAVYVIACSPVKQEPDGAIDMGSIRVKRERQSQSDGFYMNRTKKEYYGVTLKRESCASTSPYVPGELQSWKLMKLREHRARQQRMRRIKIHLRKQLLTESTYLLQVCVVFVHLLGHVVLRIVDDILDPSLGFIIYASDNAEGISSHGMEDSKEAIHNVQRKHQASNGREVFQSADEENVDGAYINDSDTASASTIAIGIASNLKNQESPNDSHDHPTAKDAPEVATSPDDGRSRHGQRNVISLSGDREIRGKFESLMKFVTLSCNTLDSLLDACRAVSCSCITEDLDVVIYDNDNVLNAAEEELGLLMHEISFLKEEISSTMEPIMSLHRGADTTIAQDESNSIIGHDDSLIDEDDDEDLSSFLDFEMDSHLGMVTFKESSKQPSAGKRLKDVELRCEWNCLIKSYIS